MLNEIRQLNTFHSSGDLLLYGAAELDYATNCKIFKNMTSLTKLTDCDVIAPTAIGTS